MRKSRNASPDTVSLSTSNPSMSRTIAAIGASGRVQFSAGTGSSWQASVDRRDDLRRSTMIARKREVSMTEDGSHPWVRAYRGRVGWGLQAFALPDDPDPARRVMAAGRLADALNSERMAPAIWVTSRCYHRHRTRNLRKERRIGWSESALSR